MRNLDLSNTQNMDLGAMSSFSYSNASGEHPSEFNLDYYNGLISNPDTTADQLRQAIIDVNNSATEYQRQSTEHASQQDYTNSAITDSWRDTALRVKDELTQKLNALPQQLNNPKIRNLIEAGEATLAPVLPPNSDSSPPTSDELKAFYNEGIREQKEGISEIGKINWIRANVPSYKWDALIHSYTQGRKSVSINSSEQQVEKTGSDEAFTTDDSSDKIMGIPKTGFYIGVGVIALVGGFLLYKKYGK